MVSKMTTKLEDANETYADIRAAFDHFNATLFDGVLPVPLLTLRGVRGNKGHFAPDRYTPHGSPGMTVPEIALNPETFEGRTGAEVLSTLVHEMAHLWDECYGSPGAPPYHSKSWGGRMLACGLQPMSARTGADMLCGPSLTHYIPEDARGDAFRAALASMPREVHLWADAHSGEGTQNIPATVIAARAKKLARGEKQRASKTKFTCPTCGANAWAKPSASLACLSAAHIDHAAVRMVCSA